MKPKQTITLLLILLGNIHVLNAQNDISNQREIDQKLFLLGNMAHLSTDSPVWDSLQNRVANSKGNTNILFLGDFLDKNGMEKPASPEEINQLEKCIQLGQTANDYFFLPGDSEWNNGKKGGKKKLKNLNKYLKEKLGKGKMTNGKGCPGPEVVDIGEHLRIIFINSHWFVHDENDRPNEQDTDCKFFNEIGFWDEVEGNIKSVINKNIIIAAHHPVYSFGQYAGYKLGRQHVTPPLIGSFLAGYHQNVGDRKDLAHHGMKSFASNIIRMMERYPTMLYVSGHEFDLQAHYFRGDYHLNSGSIARKKDVSKGEGTFFKSNKKGFLELTFFNDGSSEMTANVIQKDGSFKPIYQKMLLESVCNESKTNVPVNSRFYDCPLEAFDNQPEENQSFELPAPGTSVASLNYKRNKIGQFFWGKHYRTAWETPVQNIPYLPLDTIHGGLSPFEKGGGGQTRSLKFRGGNDREYAFRSVDKNPSVRKNRELLRGIYKSYVLDIISTQHPYGSTVTAPLLNALEIPHSDPQLFLMPDHPKLGVYREEFAGMLGWLELRPKGKNKTDAPYLEVDKVESTLEMIQALLEDNDNEADAQAFVRARLFDIWVSDWDRHHDNWKWLAYKKDKGWLFKPFPKDRDKAFTKLQGIYGYLDIEFLVKDYAQLRDNYKGMKSLNFKARNLDRILAISFTREDWQRETQDFVSVLTDEVIEDAVKNLPPEMYELTAGELIQKLKIRRDKLPEAIQKYYGMVAKYVDILGSNKREYFEVERLNNGDVMVKVHKMKKDKQRDKVLLERTFKRIETKEIRLYGLGKDDVFEVRGEKTSKSILIRIIGGKGEDKIEAHSSVSGIRKLTKVYDNSGKDEVKQDGETEVIRSRDKIQVQTDNLFNYDYHLILPIFTFNQEDGFGVNLSSYYTRQAFNKPGFGQNYTFNLTATTERNIDLNVNATFRHVIYKWDLSTSIRVVNEDRTFRNFYGLSNEGELPEELRRNDFFENETSVLAGEVGFMRRFPEGNENSSLAFNAFYEVRDVAPDTDFQESIYDSLEPGEGLGTTQLPGFGLELDLDFRNSPNFPTRGTRLHIKNTTFLNSEADWETGGKLETDASIFLTLHQIKTPVTFSFRGGLHHSYGETPFYYYSFIGQQSNHRGFRRNRFGGETAAFVNTELRWHLGTIYSPIVPFYVGLMGLYDSGRVWAKSESSDIWHNAYGGGIYIVPYTDSFNMTFTFVNSKEEDLLFNFRVGFFVK